MTIQVRTPAQAVIAAANACLYRGEVISPRQQPCREITNYSTRIDEPWRIPFELEGRDLNMRIGAIEAVQLVAGLPMPSLVETSPSLARYTIDRSGVAHGAYGQRIYGLLTRVVETLRLDHHSRQAVLTIYSSERDLPAIDRAAALDTPCTLSVQFFIRGGRLCMTVTMRSNDVWLGLPYDLVQFGALQGAVAAALDLPIGWYHHGAGSMHLYERDAEGVAKLAEVETDHQGESRLWSPGTAGDIVTRARRLAERTRCLGPQATDFEQWLDFVL